MVYWGSLWYYCGTTVATVVVTAVVLWCTGLIVVPLCYNCGHCDGHRGGTVVHWGSLWYHCGTTVATAVVTAVVTVVLCDWGRCGPRWHSAWHCGATVVQLWYNYGTTMVPLCWYYGHCVPVYDATVQVQILLRFRLSGIFRFP